MSITSNAYDLLDGFHDCTQAEQRLKEEIARTSKRKYDAPITSEGFVDAAVSGGDFPQNPYEHNERIRVQKQNYAVRGEMLKSALKSLQGRKQRIIAEHADKTLKYLGVELARLMDDVRATDKILGNIRTPEQVLNADDPRITTAWKSQQELISRYKEIRSVQHTFTNLGSDAFKIAAVGHIRNSLELTDFWLSRRGRSLSSRASRDQLEGVRNFDAWLGVGGTAPFEHSTSAIPAKDSNGNPANHWDYLVWLATTAEPWVPSVAELIAAFDAANLAVATTDYAKYRAQEAGRDRYFEVIGVKPLVAYTNGSGQEKPEKRKVRHASWGESGARAMGL